MLGKLYLKFSILGFNIIVWHTDILCWSYNFITDCRNNQKFSLSGKSNNAVQKIWYSVFSFHLVLHISVYSYYFHKHLWTLYYVPMTLLSKRMLWKVYHFLICKSSIIFRVLMCNLWLMWVTAHYAVWKTPQSISHCPLIYEVTQLMLLLLIVNDNHEYNRYSTAFKQTYHLM
jgi:hypothetical protein